MDSVLHKIFGHLLGGEGMLKMSLDSAFFGAFLCLFQNFVRFSKNASKKVASLVGGMLDLDEDYIDADQLDQHQYH